MSISTRRLISRRKPQKTVKEEYIFNLMCFSIYILVMVLYWTGIFSLGLKKKIHLFHEYINNLLKGTRVSVTCNPSVQSSKSLHMLKGLESYRLVCCGHTQGGVVFTKAVERDITEQTLLLPLK